MIPTKEQVKGFEEAAKPLVKFLNENGNPHVSAIVSTTRAVLMEGIATVKIEEFLKD